MPRQSSESANPTCQCGRKFLHNEHRCPVCRQQRMNWTKRRVDMIDLQLARVGDPLARLILVTLDLMLGEWHEIDKTIDDVMEACEMKRTAFYQRLNLLKRMQLVSVEDLPRTQKKRWRIVRSNLPDYARHQGRAEVVTTGDRPVRQGNVVRHANAAVRVADTFVRHADEVVREANNSVRHPDESVRHADDTTYFPNLSTFPTFEGVAAAMVACGVQWAVGAVEQAQRRGCSPEHLAGIVEYFRANASEHGWSAGALQRRIAQASPGISANQGSWPPTSSRARPAPPTLPELERRHGAELDALDADDVRELARQAFRKQPALWQIFNEVGAKSSDVRGWLLRFMDQQPVGGAVR